MRGHSKRCSAHAFFGRTRARCENPAWHNIDDDPQHAAWISIRTLEDDGTQSTSKAYITWRKGVRDGEQPDERGRPTPRGNKDRAGNQRSRRKDG